MQGAFCVIDEATTPRLVPNDSHGITDTELTYPELQSVAHNCSTLTTQQASCVIQPEYPSFIHINSQSLKRNHDDIVSLIHKEGLKADFIMISETWIEPDLRNSYNIVGYESVHSIPEGISRGKGAAIYIKKELYTFCTIMDSYCAKEKEYQSIFIQISPPNGTPFIVATTYRSPSYSLDVFMPYLENTLSNLSHLNRPCFWGGDFNVNLFMYNDCADAKSFLDCFSSYGLSPTITVPTRVANAPPYSRTLIDNIFCNCLDLVKVNGIIHAGIADHEAVLCTSNSPTLGLLSTPMPRHRGFDYGRIEELKCRVTEKLRGFTDLNDPDMAAEQFVLSISEETAKLSSVKTSRQFTPIQPWITPGILRSISKKNKLLKQFHSNRNHETQLKFRQYRNMLRLTIRRAKKNYFQNQFRKHAHNPRMLWADLREAIRRNKTSSELPDQFEVNGILSNNHSQIADAFNTHYSNVGPKLDLALGPAPIDPMQYMNDVQAPEMMSFNPTTEWHVGKTVTELREVGAGLDGISTKLIKSLLPVILTELTHLINLCITKSIFPKTFKLALITPIYKAGTRTNFSNYRPISILTALSKVLESIMYDQLITFISANDILYDFQFGFRQKHSTYMPISLLHDFITENLSVRRKAAAIYLDLARAFDTVNIDILLRKLSKYGIGDSAYQLLSSYLTSRSQKLKYKDIISGARDVTCGVPQGSLLGPLLFLTYINDLHVACQEAKIFLFADDTVLLYSAPTLAELQSIISRSFPKIHKWLQANRLSLSIPKTFYQIYSSQGTEPDLTIPVANSCLKRTKTVKYLGILIDENLKFKSHINKVSGICSRNLGILYRARYLLTRDLLILLYNSLVQPYLMYCSHIWGSNYPTTLKPIVTVQKRAIRLIMNKEPRTSTSPLFRELRMLKFNDLVKYQILLVLHDCLFGHLPNAVADRLAINHDPSSRTRRTQHFQEQNSTSGNIPNHRLTNYRRYVLFHAGPLLWNEVVASRIPNINDIPASKALFKKCIKIIFIDTY